MKYLRGEEKQKYRITLFCEKNKSIILHYVLRNSPENVFLRPCYSDRRIILSYCEKRKVNYYVCKKNNTFLSRNNKCHVTNIYIVEEKQKYHITFFCEKNKSIILHHVLPNRLLKTFSCGLCYSDRRIIIFILLREKESKLLCLQEEQYIPFNEQQKCHVTNLYTVEEKQSIILHSFARKTKVSYYISFTSFQTLLKTFFLRPLSC